MTQSLGVALITGASSGIGAVYADRLARRGHDLILVARNASRLEAQAAQVRAASGRTVETLVADLTDRADQRRVAEVLRHDARIAMLVNNAGVGATAPLLASDPEEMAEMIELNAGATARLALAAAAAFAARGSGAIINMASIVAVGPEILNGVYGATKAFVLALSQSLRHELADKGVRIQVVLPGATATDFWAAAGTALEQLPPQIVMPVETMVDAALAGFDQGELVTLPALAEEADWAAYEAARQNLLPKLSRSAPAPRYRASAPAA